VALVYRENRTERTGGKGGGPTKWKRGEGRNLTQEGEQNCWEESPLGGKA